MAGPSQDARSFDPPSAAPRKPGATARLAPPVPTATRPSYSFEDVSPVPNISPLTVHVFPAQAASDHSGIWSSYAASAPFPGSSKRPSAAWWTRIGERSRSWSLLKRDTCSTSISLTRSIMDTRNRSMMLTFRIQCLFPHGRRSISHCLTSGTSPFYSTHTASTPSTFTWI